MLRRAVPLALLLLLAPGLAVSALAQSPTALVRGRFIDSTTHAAIPDVRVRLTSVADSSEVHRTAAREDGTFEVRGLGIRGYRLEATRVGYAPLGRVLHVTQLDQDAGVLAMTPESVPVQGVTVTGSPPPAIQIADTTEYRADAVKTEKNATAEDLVQKLPGVTMENGEIKAQGETVQQVLVNGRPFFGNDPTAAMRNLPAEVVERIQVYDRQSDQAAFSGFDDGQSQKTMNFVLRGRNTQFGKLNAGYGDQDRYQAGGSGSIVRGATRLTLIGMSNNVNQKNFSSQDLIGASGGGGPGLRMSMGGGGRRRGRGGGGRSGGGGPGGGFDPSSFLVGQQPGVATTHSGGMNYAGQWSPKLQVTTSLFVNHSNTDNTQTLARQYLPVQDSLAVYDQQSRSDERNGNQRFDARLDWQPDSLNSMILQPRLYFQQNDARSSGTARNATPDDITLGATQSAASGTTDADNLSSRLTLRHRFGRPGRNVSADLNVGHSLHDGSSDQVSSTQSFFAGSTATDTLDQQSGSRVVTDTFGARIAYTEPLRPGLQGQLVWNPGLSSSRSRARTFALDPLTGLYSLPDSTLSNSFENRTTTQNGAVSTLLTAGSWKLLSSLAAQRTTLHSVQRYPASQTVDQSFNQLLPMASLTASFGGRRSLRLSYNTSSNAPSISQLQNVVNNSNPLSLSSGNPDLRPSHNQTLSLRFSEATPMRSRSRFVFANVTRTSRPIANSTFTAARDTLVDGVELSPGTQLTSPVNLDEAAWNASVFGVYSLPANYLKSIASLNGGGTLTRTPARINGETNIGTSYVIRSGVTLASNISQNLDFTLSYQGAWNRSRNTLTTSSRGDYYSHTLGLRLNVVAGPGVVLREEVSHNLQSGVPSAFGQNVVLWNTSLGKKLFKGDRGELRLTANDVLNENRSVSRSVADAYVEDARNRTLGRYLQAVFSYSFR